MAANLQIDGRLPAKANQVGGFQAKKETVNQALAEFVRRREQRNVTELFGTVDFTADFDSKKPRAKRRESCQTRRFGRLLSGGPPECGVSTARRWGSWWPEA